MQHKIKNIHFVGIGGSGMSGIAEVLVTLGYNVSGSDLGSYAVTQRLVDMGATVHQGHDAAFIGNADAFTIGVSGEEVTYDFELFSHSHSKEECKKGGWETFNPDRPEGPYKNQGDCVSEHASQGKAKGNPGQPTIPASIP